MTSKGLKTRDKIDPKYKWNIEAMISDESRIDPDLQKIRKQAEKFAAKYAGHLGDSAQTLYDAFAESDSIMRKLEKIYVYADSSVYGNNYVISGSSRARHLRRYRASRAPALYSSPSRRILASLRAFFKRSFTAVPSPAWSASRAS